MKQLKMIGQNVLIKSDKFTELIVKIILACSAVIIACEFYILLKL
jgi:hypothetical protein